MEPETKCIGCDRPAFELFDCPCDLQHPICSYHTLRVRRDCAHVGQWDEQAEQKVELGGLADIVERQYEQGDGEVTVAEMKAERATPEQRDADAGKAQREVYERFTPPVIIDADATQEEES